MGLFVAQDGHYQGWLAALLCCIAAIGEDEHPIEKEKSRPTTRAGTCQQQRVPLTALPKLPTARGQVSFKGDEPVFPSRHDGDYNAVSAQPPLLRPLELGDSLLSMPRVAHQRRKSSFGHSKKPSIGAPSAFRRVEYTDGQRASLVPLRLGPVVLTNMPNLDSLVPTTIAETTETEAPSARERSDSTQGLLSRGKRESYRVQRDTPSQRCQQTSSAALSAKTSASSFDSIRQMSSPVSPNAEPRTTRPSISRESSSSSLHRQALETRASSSERTRLKRKRSLQNVRKASTDVGDRSVEKEILELNTIGEERRAEQARPQSPEAQHVAAIAPATQVRARSETLNDIGSALARPFTTRVSSDITNIFDSPVKPTRPATSRASSRVSGWLTSLVPTVTLPPTATTEPFYRCAVAPARQRPYSETSLCTSTASVTEVESPSLTAASSPTTKGHSRSLTAESRLTPISPPSTIYDREVPDARKDAEEHWPVEIPQSQVGLAF